MNVAALLAALLAALSAGWALTRRVP
jgi:hypothetical protein